MLTWRAGLALLAILSLLAVGLRFAYVAWFDHAVSDAVFALVCIGFFLGAATTYAFGYFVSLPDILADAPLRLDTLRRRWSDFSLLACAVAVLISSLSYAKVLSEEHGNVVIPIVLLLLVACPWLLSACVVAADHYLGWTLPSSPVARPTAWRSRIRRLVERFGNSLLFLAGRRRAVAVGAGLVLASLFTGIVATNLFFSPDPGYVWIAEIAKPWPLSVAKLPGVLIEKTPLLIYILGLVVAPCAAVAVFLRRRTSPRVFRILGILTAVIALFELIEMASQAFSGLDPDSHSPLAWVLGCLLPASLWLALAHSSSADRRERARLALLVYCVPVFLLGFSFLPFFFYLIPGRGFFVVGILFLWWGLLQHGVVEAR